MKSRRKVLVRQSAIGRGVFAQRCFHPEEVIGEVHGTIIDDPLYGSDYGMDLGGNLTLEPKAPFRYLNHSCQPNCELFVWQTDDLATPAPRMWLQAITLIFPGDELLIDYAWPADSAIPCMCRSPICRGWVVDLADLPKLTDRLCLQ